MADEVPYRYGNTGPDQIMILTADGQYVCSIQVVQSGGGMIAEAMEEPRKKRGAFIVLACNNHARLLTALKNILQANAEFRDAMPQDWEGDPLQDACEEARKVVESIARGR